MNSISAASVVSLVRHFRLEDMRRFCKAPVQFVELLHHRFLRFAVLVVVLSRPLLLVAWKRRRCGVILIIRAAWTGGYKYRAASSNYRC